MLSAPKTAYARVLVYSPVKTWWAEVPEAEVIKNLGSNGLHYAVARPRRLLMALFFGLGIPLALSVVMMQLLPLLVALGVFFLAALVGGGLGWYTGAVAEKKALRNGRVWFVRSIYAEKERSVTPMRYEAVTVQIEKDMLEAILGEEIATGQMPSVPAANGAKQDTKDSLVIWRPDWNAKSFYEDWIMKDWQAELKGGASIWAKVQIGAFAVTAVALLFIAFVAFMSQTRGGEPSGATQEVASNDQE